MRVFYITAGLPHGPGETFVATEIAALQRRGLDVFVIPVNPKGDIVHPEAKRLSGASLVHGLLDLELLSAAARALMRIRGWQALRLAMSAKPRRLLRSLAVFPKAAWLAETATSFKANHLHAHFASAPATTAMMASVMCGVPWSFTAHRYDILEDDQLALKARKAAFARFISRDGIAAAVERGVDPADTLLIHMGVETPADPAPRPPIRSVVWCPAGLRPIKGHRFLIDAVAILRDRGVLGEHTIDLSVVFAGDGPSRRDLESQASRQGVRDRIEFRGLVTHADLLHAVNTGEVHAVVLPSLHEGVPVALMEAAAAGLPIVATAVGGTPELLGGGAGVLVDSEDAMALADGLEHILTNHAEAEALGDNARATIKAAFDVDTIAAELYDLFGAADASTPAAQ